MAWIHCFAVGRAHGAELLYGDLRNRFGNEALSYEDLMFGGHEPVPLARSTRPPRGAADAAVIVLIIGPGANKRAVGSLLPDDPSVKPSGPPVVAILLGGMTKNVLPPYEPGIEICHADGGSWPFEWIAARIEKHTPGNPRGGPLTALTERYTPAKVRAPVKHEVFVSYAFEDQVFVDALAAALEHQSNGIRCFVAQRDVPTGMEYAKMIPGAIRSSRLMLVVVSKHSNGSEDVLNEVTLAKDAKVRRLPLLIDDSPLDDGLAYFFSQAVRLHAAGMAPDAAIAMIVKDVKHHLR